MPLKASPRLRLHSGLALGTYRPQPVTTRTASRLVGDWPLPDTRASPNTYLRAALCMNARLTIQFGVSHFLEICGVWYRVFTASLPMRLLRLGSPQTRDVGPLLFRS